MTNISTATAECNPWATPGPTPTPVPQLTPIPTATHPEPGYLAVGADGHTLTPAAGICPPRPTRALSFEDVQSASRAPMDTATETTSTSPTGFGLDSPFLVPTPTHLPGGLIPTPTVIETPPPPLMPHVVEGVTPTAIGLESRIHLVLFHLQLVLTEALGARLRDGGPVPQGPVGPTLTATAFSLGRSRFYPIHSPTPPPSGLLRSMSPTPTVTPVSA